MSEVKTKLEISGKNSPEIANASYKPIPEQDMEEQAAVESTTRPKSVSVKLKIVGSAADVADDESERMLPAEDEKIPEVVVCNNDTKSPQNGDAKLDIAEPPNKQAFVGLTKEELMKYANDPFWVRLRWFLFVTFWLLWAAMLIGAILIIYAAPKCDPPAPRTWYEKGPLTQLTPDVKLEELKLDENIQGMIVPWHGDVYAPLEESSVGDLERLRLAQKVAKRVIVEVDPTWSEVWFGEAEKKNPEFEGYYVWATGSDGKPPNNWVNLNNTTTWKLSTARNQFYYAPFDRPHLNFQNATVIDQFKRVIDQFLRYNVTGIRLRHASFLLIDQSLANFDIDANVNSSYGLGQYRFYKHTQTEDSPKLGPLLAEWRNYLKNRTGEEEMPLMVAEELAKVESYKVNQSLAVDMPLLSTIFSRASLNVNETLSNLNYSLKINNVTWPLWEAKTTAVPRDVLHIITYLLPGAPLINATEKVNPDLLKIRSNPSIMRYGNESTFEVYGLQNNTVMSFIRVTPGSPGILVAVNPSDNLVTTNLPAEIYKLSSIQEVTVTFYSENYNVSDFKDIGSKRAANSVPISAKSAIVLEYVPKKDE